MPLRINKINGQKVVTRKAERTGKIAIPTAKSVAGYSNRWAAAARECQVLRADRQV
jgi:hypothetical protein